MYSGHPADAFVHTKSSGVTEAKSNSKYPGRLIDELGIRELLNARVPVNIESVAMFMGAESVQRVDISVAGMLLPTEESFRILINKNESWKRQRFSCAHEIAHFIFDPKRAPSMRQGTRHEPNALERHCDELAAQLLMPDPTFSRYANADVFSIQSIINLANAFQTSIKATTIRALEVIDEPCIAIVSAMSNGRTGTRLRLQWGSQNVRRLRAKRPYFLPKRKSVNLDTARMAYETNHVQTRSEFTDIGKLKFKAYTESKGFGSGKSRYVLSLVFPER